MPGKDNRSHRIPPRAKLPKIKTINDILTRDDINGILQDLDNLKPDISDLIVIYKDKRDDKYYFLITEDTLSSTAVWMLEGTKLDVMNLDNEDD